MKDNLGPHTLHYLSPTGKTDTITLTIFPGEAWRTDLGDGRFLDEETASIDIVGDWFIKVITLHGLNDIQFVYRLLWTADIYVQKICQDNDYEVYKHEPGDVDRERHLQLRAMLMGEV